MFGKACFAILFFNCFAQAAYAESRSASFLLQFEASDCFLDPGVPLKCFSPMSEFRTITIQLAPNTVPNPYGSNGWEGSWTGTTSFAATQFTSAIRIEVEETAGKSIYRLVTQVWSDPQQIVEQDLLLNSLSEMPEITLKGALVLQSDNEFAQPRLTIKATDRVRAIP